MSTMMVAVETREPPPETFRFRDADAAIDYAEKLYNEQVGFLVERLRELIAG